MKAIMTLIFSALLFGCATTMEKNSSIQVPIKKGAPVVYVHPLSLAPYRQASLGILPFIMPANMQEEQARQIAALYRDIFLGKQAFSRIKLLDERYYDSAQAVSIGRQAKTDLVLAGVVNYAMESTDLGGARLDVAVRLLNCATGSTVWYIGQSMDQPMDFPKTDLWSRAVRSLGQPPIKRPKGAPALVNMMAQSAVDMAEVMNGASLVRR